MGLSSVDDEEIIGFDMGTSLLQSRNMSPVVHPDHRRGNLWTALAHIITGVIGSGVLSLAWSMSRLGWVAGPITMLLFASVSFISASLLCSCYKSPDPDIGPNSHGSYLDAVQSILGKKKARVCGVFVIINYVKTDIVYTVTASTSLRAILRSNCYHDQGHEAACDYNTTYFMLIFGAIQIFVSQIRNFQNMKWLSAVAAIMSFAYSTIGSGLGLARIIENGEVRGDIRGVPTSTAAQKVWSVAQALGDIAFSFPFSLYFLEIQDTLRSPPSEKATMKKASTIAVCIITFFYFCCGGFGYAAFGNSTPGNILTGFGFYEPYWLVDFANACIVLHLIGGYQIFCQPFFGLVERRLARRFPDSTLVHDSFSLKLTSLPALELNFLRILFRTAYVVCITGVAMLFPYFNEIVGVAGAVNFWPIIVYFPVEMYLVQKNIEAWTLKSIVLRTYSFICLVVIVSAFIGSVKALLSAKFK